MLIELFSVKWFWQKPCHSSFCRFLSVLFKCICGHCQIGTSAESFLFICGFQLQRQSIFFRHIYIHQNSTVFAVRTFCKHIDSLLSIWSSIHGYLIQFLTALWQFRRLYHYLLLTEHAYFSKYFHLKQYFLFYQLRYLVHSICHYILAVL